jgi:hypothetical protein
MAANTRTTRPAVEPAEVNLDPHTFTHDGVEYTIPSFASCPAGVIRKARHEDEGGQFFTVLEHLVTDEDALAAIDSMVGPEFADFVADWQRAAGVQLPN